MRRSLKWFLSVLIALILFTSGALSQDLGIERDRAKKMLQLAAKHIEKDFYDPNLKGMDLPGVMREANARIDNAKSVGEMMTAIFAMLNKLDDSHTVFLPPQRLAHAKFGFEGKAFGNDVYVYKLDKQSAARDAGLQLGDRILAINGYGCDRSNWDLLMLVMRALRPVGQMEFTIQRGAGEPQKILVAAKIKTDHVEMDLTELGNVYRLIREAERDEEIFLYSNSKVGIGYLFLPNFMSDELNVLARKVDKSKAIIVDLRGNPGGAVDYMETFAGAFMAQPTVMAEMQLRKKNEEVKAKPFNPKFLGPMFILVDSQTASAAEVFARHFQITKRAVVIGDRTSGRVSVARIFPEALGAESIVPFGVQVTVGKLVFPGGEVLEKKGVVPDELCIPSSEDLRLERDVCRNRAYGLALKALGLTEKDEKGN